MSFHHLAKIWTKTRKKSLFRKSPKFIVFSGDTLVKKLHKLANQTIELLWRFFEVHISKIVFVIIAIFIANNVSEILKVVGKISLNYNF